jgi:hypothetical protein
MKKKKAEFCIVTGLPINNKQGYGRYHSRVIHKLFLKYGSDIEETKKHVYEDLIYVEDYNMFYASWHDCSKGLGKGTDLNADKKHIFEKYFKPVSKCILPDCDNQVEYEFIRYKSCCILHYNQSKEKSLKNRDNFKYVSLEDGNKFSKLRNLSRHIKSLGIELEDYYKKYYMKEGDGRCKWCDTPTKFENIEVGYTNFCYNSECNVLWYNKHTNRKKIAADKTSKIFLEGDRLPSQVPYWIKKGYDEETSKQMVLDRRVINSVDAIMQRKNCSKEEAEQFRADITKKWIKSFQKMTYSKISQELFWGIYDKIKDNYNNIFFATLDPSKNRDDSRKNHEFLVNVGKTHRKLDFYIKDINKCIEFDGTYWHGIKGKGNKSREEEREKQIIKTLNCKILHIKEADFVSNKEEVINRCLDFIENG